MSDPNFFLSRLNGEPHALAFGGQSTPWPVALADLTNDPALEATLRGHVAAANTMLAPVAADLLATTGRARRPVRLQAEPRHGSVPPPRRPSASKASHSLSSAR